MESEVRMIEIAQLVAGLGIVGFLLWLGHVPRA
jgi:hypothetical protein